jgi:parallel beta-helix repeat protein
MAITVKSEYGADTTIIDGSSPAHPDTGSVVLFISGEDTNSVLRGFTLTNGTGTLDPGYGPLGGGILCFSGSSPTIDSNTITSNSAVYGGGMSCEFNSSPLIIDNTIIANSAMGSGGGIELYVNSSPTIIGNIITGNNAASHGGGVQCYTNCSPLVSDNEITNNSAVGLGGGLRIGETSSPTVRDNLIQGNSTLNGGGILCDGGPFCSPHIVHNTINENTATGYGGGIVCEYNVTPTIDSCIIAYNNGYEIVCHLGGNPVIHYNNLADTAGSDYLVWNVDPNVTVDAEYNWWGDSTGPYHPTGNPSGQGGAVSDHVDFDPWLLNPGIEEHNASVPVRLVLQVTPNPFRNFTNIRYTIHDPGYTIQKPKLRIFDVCGRLVKTFGLESVIENPGSTISWCGDDETGREVASGVYFVRLIAAESSTTKKILLVR